MNLLRQMATRGAWLLPATAGVVVVGEGWAWPLPDGGRGRVAGAGARVSLIPPARDRRAQSDKRPTTRDAPCPPQGASRRSAVD